MAERFDEAETFTGAIVMCPVCVTPQDAEAYGHLELECDTCGTMFTVELVKEKVAAHALYGS